MAYLSVLKTVLIRIHKWSKDRTRTTSLVSRRRNGAHGNKRHMSSNNVKVCYVKHSFCNFRI